MSVVSSVHSSKCKLLSSSPSALHNFPLTHLFAAISTRHPQGCHASAIHSLHPPPELLGTLTLLCLGPGYPPAKTFTCLCLIKSITEPQASLLFREASKASVGSGIAPPQGSSFFTAFCSLNPHHLLFPSLWFSI